MFTMAKPVNKNWPKRLRKLRDRLKLKQAGMAALIGCALRSYVDWENGKRVPVMPYQLLIEDLENSEK